MSAGTTSLGRYAWVLVLITILVMYYVINGIYLKQLIQDYQKYAAISAVSTVVGLSDVDVSMETVSGVRSHAERGYPSDVPGDDHAAPHHQVAVIEGAAHIIAVGGGITTRNVAGLSPATLHRLPFFRILLPSFCRTASDGYHYRFYLAYDADDAFLGDAGRRDAFEKRMLTYCASHCPRGSDVTVRLVRCPHHGRPAWAHNDAMLEAYIDGAEYYFRVTDDVGIVTKGWTEAFIAQLAAHTPANVGVVGPTHSGGNPDILTFEFTHRKHIDIFGFHYPRVFTSWWSDDWLTAVYRPGRWRRLPRMMMRHTGWKHARYEVGGLAPKRQLKQQIAIGKETLSRYVTSLHANVSRTQPEVSGLRVIAVTLYGNNTKYTYGAIRNAQLAPVIYPGWTIRFYVPGSSMGATLQVPTRILLTLKWLGAEVSVMPYAMRDVAPRYWSFLVGDDASVDVFLVRKVEARLSTRGRAAVEEWLTCNRTLHIIKDHPPSGGRSGAEPRPWGARRRNLITAIGKPINEIIKHGNNILSSVIQPVLTSSTLCHDSSTCLDTTMCAPFPVSPGETGAAGGRQYVEQEYDQYMVSAYTDNVQRNSIHSLKCP